MSDVLYRRTEVPGSISPAIPPGDLTEAQFRALRPDYRREVRNSPLYELVAGAPEPVSPPPPVITLDPLGEMDDAAFEAMSPSEKGLRTREAKKRAEDAATPSANQEGGN